VDDQADSQEMIVALLEQRGAGVVQCGSAESTLTLLERDSPDLLIADIAMPEVDGYELMRRLRASGCRVPAIAVTAYARPDDCRRAIACGYTSCLAKPVDAAELARTIRDVLPTHTRRPSTASAAQPSN
jgi:CheY-like chemotaxis protein